KVWSSVGAGYLVTAMNKFDEMREDMRLARLNNGPARFLFLLLDIFKGLLKVAALGCFALGIWYLTYGFDHRQPAPPSAAPVGAVERIGVPVADNHSGGSKPAAALSPERIALLKQFADANRLNGGTAESELPVAAASTAQTQSLPDSTAIVVATPVAESQVIGVPVVSADSIELAENNTALDNTVRSVFDDLQQKLRSAENGNTDTDLVPPLALVEEDIALVSGPEAVVAPSTPDVNDVITVQESKLQTAPVSVNANQVFKSNWIMAQDENDFLIQIGSTTNYPFLVQFEKQLPSSQPTAIFEMLIGQQPEHVLSYGLFPTREAATSELGRLSQTARKYGAYVRKLSAVQRQIRELGNNLAIAQKAVN
ncbi:MAG: hypothetical protein AAF404_15825, partial [Pseudomonadota bacterium]